MSVVYVWTSGWGEEARRRANQLQRRGEWTEGKNRRSSHLCDRLGREKQLGGRRSCQNWNVEFIMNHMARGLLGTSFDLLIPGRFRDIWTILIQQECRHEMGRRPVRRSCCHRPLPRTNIYCVKRIRPLFEGKFFSSTKNCNDSLIFCRSIGAYPMSLLVHQQKEEKAQFGEGWKW